MEKKRPILSIGMLASDRLDTLPRCLESLTPIREAFPCELIVVDTSKNPQVCEVIKQYADKIDTFEWCNDFAKARNATLKLAEGEWFMFIDDDEWFAEPEALIEFFKSGEYKKYGYAHHRIKNFHNPDFTAYNYAWVTRLIKIGPETQFRSKVHEYLYPFEGEDIAISATSYHSGYIFRTQEERDTHFKRNSELLKKMEKEEPDELRWKVQMMQEFISQDNWKGLIAYAKGVLEYLWGKTHKVDACQFATLHIAYARGLVMDEQFEKVRAVYDKIQPVVKDWLVCRAYMELYMAEAYWGLKDYTNAITYAQKYVECYNAFKKDSKRHNTEILRLMLTDTFHKNNVSKAYCFIMGGKIRLGDKECLYELYPKLQWDNEDIGGYCSIEVDILMVLLEKEDYAMLEKVLKDAFATKNIRPRMMRAILAYREKDAEVFASLLDIIRELDVQSWYKHYAKIMRFGTDVSKEEVLESAYQFIQLIPNIFSIPNEIEEVLKRHAIQPADLYVAIDFEKWKDELKDKLETSKMEEVDKLYEYLQDSVLIDDIRYHYFMMIYTEQKALLASRDNLSFDELTEILAEFSIQTSLCYEKMVGTQLQQLEVTQWPPKYEAAKWLEIFYAEVGNDIKSALGCLAKVIAVYPRLAEVMRYYLERIQVEIIDG